MDAPQHRQRQGQRLPPGAVARCLRTRRREAAHPAERRELFSQWRQPTRLSAGLSVLPRLGPGARLFEPLSADRPGAAGAAAA